MRRLLVLLTLLTLAATAQTPPIWDLTGIHEITTPISQLNPPDRHEILKHLQIVASQLRGEAVTAPNRDQTFVVQGYGSDLCGGTGNCSFWVFDAQHNILVKTVAQTFRFLPQIHNGKNDLLTAMHDSATSSDLTHWQFDGRRYHPIKCATVDYADPIGNSYPRPKFTPSKCD